jgi:hypothetical protein
MKKTPKSIKRSQQQHKNVFEIQVNNKICVTSKVHFIILPIPVYYRLLFHSTIRISQKTDVLRGERA